MNTFSHPALAHDPSGSDFYDPDEVVPKNSPLLAASRPNLRPSPTPSLELPPPKPKKHKPNPGDVVLLSFLGNNTRPDIANAAARQSLQSDTSEDTPISEVEESGDEQIPKRQELGRDLVIRGGDGKPGREHSGTGAGDMGGDSRRRSVSVDACRPVAGTPAAVAPLDDLQSLAAGALGALAFGDHRAGISGDTSRTPTSLDISSIDRDRERGREREGGRAQGPLDGFPRRDGPLNRERDRDERSGLASALSPYSSRSSAYSHSPLQSSLSPINPMANIRSPTSISRTMTDELPPIGVTSPRSETNGSGHNLLPSIRDTLGGHMAPLGHMAFSESSNQDTRHGAPFPHSPPGSLSRFGPVGHCSPPPISPNDPYHRRDLPSPAHLSAATSPYYTHHPLANGYPRQSADYSGSSTTETPGSSTDHASTPGNAVSERITVDGLTTTVGQFVCQYPGCNAMPFQTQYLLNSHANVHSSARPHYCPVKGCPRGETGKGFKRKNEMIRHGLVHDSPGYICPFCPDREHKYPRPDNLQRHVRVHHVDKDKDDSLLREVLAQRPDGPSRGRRRRHGPSA